MDDAGATVRFSLIGAMSRAVREGGATEDQRRRVLARLELDLQGDADSGVRSRAATALGECGEQAQLTTLWKSASAGGDGRVQEKAWQAFLEIAARSGDAGVAAEWDKTLAADKQGARRLQLLTELSARWQKRTETKAAAAETTDLLIQAQLDQGKWAAALPLLRDRLSQAGVEAEQNRRLRWLLTAAEQALAEGAKAEAFRAARDAQPYLPRNGELFDLFAKLEEKASRKE
jgi:hypothetical protein